MITERTLKKWRGEALEVIEKLKDLGNLGECTYEYSEREMSQRILRLTQVLLDQHLLHNLRFKGVKNDPAT